MLYKKEYIDNNKLLKEENKILKDRITKAVKLLNKYRNRKDHFALWCMEYEDNAEVIHVLGGEIKHE